MSPGLSLTGGDEWVMGVLINIVGSITINFGTNLMKSSHNIAGKVSARVKSLSNAANGSGLATAADDLLDEASRFGNNADVVWRLGMSVFVFGSVVNFVSFAFAAQSLLACLGTVQFISNVFFAKLVLKETLTSRIIFATGVIVCGLVVAIACSNHAEASYNVSDLINLYTYKYLCFTFGELCVLLVLQLVYVRYTRSAEEGVTLYGHRLVVPCCYAQISAAIGTQSLLQSKCMAELLKATIEGDNQLTNPFTYVIILGFVTGISFWLYRMNAALKMFEGLIIIPLLQVFWTTSAILQGGVYFQEFEKFTATQVFGFTSGVIIVFFGVYLLAPSDRESSCVDDCFDSDADASSTHMNQSLHPIGPASTTVAVRKKIRKSGRVGGKDDIVDVADMEGLSSSIASSMHRAGAQLSTMATNMIHRERGHSLYQVALDSSMGNESLSRAETGIDVSVRSDMSDLSGISAASSQFVNPLHRSSSPQRKSKGSRTFKKIPAKMEI